MNKPGTPPSPSELVFYQGEDGRSELGPAPTIRKFRIVQTEGNREVSRLVDHHNLDVERTRLTVEASDADEFDKAAKQLGTKRPRKPEKGAR